MDVDPLTKSNWPSAGVSARPHWSAGAARGSGPSVEMLLRESTIETGF